MRNGVCDPKGFDFHFAKGLGEILPGTLGKDSMCHIHADVLGTSFLKSLYVVREDALAKINISPES